MVGGRLRRGGGDRTGRSREGAADADQTGVGLVDALPRVLEVRGHRPESTPLGGSHGAPHSLVSLGKHRQGPIDTFGHHSQPLQDHLDL